MLFKGTMFDTLKYTIITVALFGLSDFAVIFERMLLLFSDQI